MPDLNKSIVAAALACSGFENWRSPLAAAQPNRPTQRPNDLPGVGKTAAVTLLIYPAPPNDIDTDRTDPIENSKDLHLVLTKRHHGMTQHAGQISLPGGRQDPGESLSETALRETQEEIGISLQPSDIMGQLGPAYVPPSDFTVTPFVAWLDQRSEFVLAVNEVDEVLSVPFSTLLDSRNRTTRTVANALGSEVVVPCYIFQKHVIWGATAMMVSELVTRVEKVMRT